LLLKTGADLFVQIPDGTAQRFLHRARVVAISESGYVVALRASLALEVDDEILVYFTLEREFVQQPARISALLSDGPTDEPRKAGGEFQTGECEEVPARDSPQRLVCLETVADPISAENRTEYRIRVSASDVSSTLDTEKCEVEDISPTGLALFSNRRHERGTIVPASIRYQDGEYTGRVCIRSARASGSRTRYGVSYVADPGGRSEIEAGLRAISRGIPREHPADSRWRR
jgi:hypothetical protein